MGSGPPAAGRARLTKPLAHNSKSLSAAPWQVRAVTKDHPSLFDAISTVIVIGMIVGLLTGMLPG